MCVLHSPSAVRLPVRISGRLNGTALQIQIDKFKIIVLVFFFEWSCLFWDLFLHGALETGAGISCLTGASASGTLAVLLPVS